MKSLQGKVTYAITAVQISASIRCVNKLSAAKCHHCNQHLYTCTICQFLS